MVTGIAELELIPQPSSLLHALFLRVNLILVDIATAHILILIPLLQYHCFFDSLDFLAVVFEDLLLQKVNSLLWHHYLVVFLLHLLRHLGDDARGEVPLEDLRELVPVEAEVNKSIS